MPRPVRLMHFADVHFGVENFGRFDPATGLPSRLVDFKNALNAAIDSALAADVELAVFAGDAYKTRDPSQTHQREFAACLSRLTGEGIPVVLLAGNHDIPNTKGRANAIEIFGALSGKLVQVFDTPRAAVITTKTGTQVQIAAVPYLIKSLVLSKEENAGKGVQDTTALVVEKYVGVLEHLAAQCDPSLPTVLMGHFSVSNAKLSAGQVGYLTNEPEVPLSALARPEFDYVALGHIHRFQDLNRGHQPPVVYCGSVERIDFGERSEDKGYALVELVKGDTLVRHVTVPTRPFVEIHADASDAGDAPTEYLLAQIAKHALTNAVVKMSYTMRSEQASHLRENEVRDALSPAFMVVSLHKEIVKDDAAARSRALSESLDPLAALGLYLRSRETLRAREDELVAAATPLVRTLEQEESIQ